MVTAERFSLSAASRAAFSGGPTGMVTRRRPLLLPQSDSVHTVLWKFHYYLAFAFFALVSLHVAAGLFHALVRRDGVFATMSPLPLKGRETAVE
jgi:cytochrome b561